MKRKRGIIAAVALIAVVVLVFVGYNIYRYPALFKSLSDESLSDEAVNALREEIAAAEDKQILVAYFSHSGTTRTVATALSEETGADLFEISPQQEYSDVYRQSNREIRNDERPALSDTVENMEEYDIVFVGYPVWWHATPAPVNTFLESYDLSGKLIIPFCTSGGSDIDETMPTFLNSCEGLAVYGGRRISGTSELSSWLEDLNLNLDGIIAQGAENGPESIPGASESGTVDIRVSDQPVYEYETQEMVARRDGNQIYGVLYIPQDAGEVMPAIIYSHGFGGSHRSGSQYAAAMAARGYVVYCFDFCGGSSGSRSDGSPYDISIFTEQEDLEAVISMIQSLEYVDEDNLFLMGTSQGGVVSAITAADHIDEIRGMVLLYPAFVLVDNANELFQSPEEIPDTQFFLWMDVGRAYFEPLLDYDIYADIEAYDKDVLILHGDADSIVPLSYSERAAEVYPSAELEVLQGAGHGFSGENAQAAIAFMTEYYNSHIN